MTLALVLVAAGLSVVPDALTATAPRQVPCWKELINEWYGGGITTIFPHRCYTEALQKLPRLYPVWLVAERDIQGAEAAAARPQLTKGASWRGSAQLLSVAVGSPESRVKAIHGTVWLVRGSCVLYRVSKPGTSIDGREFCFSDGRVSRITTAVHG